jgi:hypothetical protein
MEDKPAVVAAAITALSLSLTEVGVNVASRAANVAPSARISPLTNTAPPILTDVTAGADRYPTGATSPPASIERVGAAMKFAAEENPTETAGKAIAYATYRPVEFRGAYAKGRLFIAEPMADIQTPLISQG